MSDPINHPSHYTSHPSGVEVIDLTRWHSFVPGNALKYVLRHRHKGRPAEDLAKALWYINHAHFCGDFVDRFSGRPPAQWERAVEKYMAAEQREVMRDFLRAWKLFHKTGNDAFQRDIVRHINDMAQDCARMPQDGRFAPKGMVDR